MERWVKRREGARDKRVTLNLSMTKRESEGTNEREPPKRASLVDFLKKCLISSMLIFAFHFFYPFLELFPFFPISIDLSLYKENERDKGLQREENEKGERVAKRREQKREKGLKGREEYCFYGEILTCQYIIGGCKS